MGVVRGKAATFHIGPPVANHATGAHVSAADMLPAAGSLAGRQHTGALRRSNYCVTCERSPSGRIRHSSSARHAFRELHLCPATGSTAGPCPGYVVDHDLPLKRGGTDSPENMQWQSTADAKAKDRVE